MVTPRRVVSRSLILCQRSMPKKPRRDLVKDCIRSRTFSSHDQSKEKSSKIRSKKRNKKQIEASVVHAKLRLYKPHRAIQEPQMCRKSFSQKRKKPKQRMPFFSGFSVCYPGCVTDHFDSWAHAASNRLRRICTTLPHASESRFYWIREKNTPKPQKSKVAELLAELTQVNLLSRSKMRKMSKTPKKKTKPKKSTKTKICSAHKNC